MENTNTDINPNEMIDEKERRFWEALVANHHDCRDCRFNAEHRPNKVSCSLVNKGEISHVGECKGWKRLDEKLHLMTHDSIDKGIKLYHKDYWELSDE